MEHNFARYWVPLSGCQSVTYMLCIGVQSLILWKWCGVARENQVKAKMREISWYLEVYDSGSLKMQQIHGLTLIQGSEDKIKFSNYGRQAGARLCQAKLATKCCKRQAVWAGLSQAKIGIVGENWRWLKLLSRIYTTCLDHENYQALQSSRFENAKQIMFNGIIGPTQPAQESRVLQVHHNLLNSRNTRLSNFLQNFVFL